MPSALKREYPALHLWVIFDLLDPYPLTCLNPDPIRIRIRNTGERAWTAPVRVHSCCNSFSKSFSRRKDFSIVFQNHKSLLSTHNMIYLETYKDAHLFKPSSVSVLRIRIRKFFWASWIRILLASNKHSKKSLDSYCFVTSFGCKCTLEK